MIQLRIFLGCCSNMDVARLQGNGQNKKNLLKIILRGSFELTYHVRPHLDAPLAARK